MRVTVLGAGDAFSSGGQRQSGYLVETHRATFLLDCGTTTLLALKSLQIPAEQIDFVAISHMHGDHFGGLPFLFLEYLYENPRTRPLHIVGPPLDSSVARAESKTSFNLTPTSCGDSPSASRYLA